MLPGLSLYLIAGAVLFTLQIPPEVVSDELYFSAAWQTVFVIDNSFLVWGGLLLFAILRRLERWIAMTVEAQLLRLLDFPCTTMTAARISDCRQTGFF